MSCVSLQPVSYDLIKLSLQKLLSSDFRFFEIFATASEMPGKIVTLAVNFFYPELCKHLVVVTIVLT